MIRVTINKKEGMQVLFCSLFADDITGLVSVCRGGTIHPYYDNMQEFLSR